MKQHYYHGPTQWFKKYQTLVTICDSLYAKLWGKIKQWWSTFSSILTKQTMFGCPMVHWIIYYP